MNNIGRIIRVMVDRGPMQVVAIRKATGLSGQLVNHYLKRLLADGVVTKQGTGSYSVRPFLCKFNMDQLAGYLGLLGRLAVDEVGEVQASERERIVLNSLWALVDAVIDELKQSPSFARIDEGK